MLKHSINTRDEFHFSVEQRTNEIEPPHEKTNNVAVPAKTQISLGIRPV